MAGDGGYPSLGFDPCPGSVESVAVLRQRVGAAAESVDRANELVNRVRYDGSPVWRGAAGDAFRQHLSATLIDDLGGAHQSLQQAVTALQGWGGALVEFRHLAAGLEQQAARTVQRLESARSRQRDAAADPDLGLVGRYFVGEVEARDAERRSADAALALRGANGEVDAAEDELAAVRRRAEDLRDEWEQASRRVAEELRRAAEFAPGQPGVLRRMGQGIADAASAVDDWVGDHRDEIHDVLGTVSAVSGLVALCTPPPVDVVAFAVSLVAGAGALATTVADPRVRADLGEMLHGEFAGNWGSAVQLGGDALGVVPGATLAWKSATAGGDLLAAGSRGFPTIVDIASEVAHAPGFVMENVAKIPGTGKALEGLQLLEKGAATDVRGATADMLNFLNKTVGSGQKTVGTTWGLATGGDD